MPIIQYLLKQGPVHDNDSSLSRVMSVQALCHCIYCLYRQKGTQIIQNSTDLLKHIQEPR
jgi:hypothetical protein